MIGADAHDLGTQGFELRQRRLEALELFRSGGGERRDEVVEDDGTLVRQVGQLDGLAVDAVQREVGRLLSDLEGARATDEGDADQDGGDDAPEQQGYSHGTSHWADVVEPVTPMMTFRFHRIARRPSAFAGLALEPVPQRLDDG